MKRSIAPLYDIRLKYKAELNWYFDIAESKKDLSVILKDLAVVNYALGRFGYKNFWKNQIECISESFINDKFWRFSYPHESEGKVIANSASLQER